MWSRLVTRLVFFYFVVTLFIYFFLWLDVVLDDRVTAVNEANSEEPTQNSPLDVLQRATEDVVAPPKDRPFKGKGRDAIRL